jgi:hypothetical protein
MFWSIDKDTIFNALQMLWKHQAATLKSSHEIREAFASQQRVRQELNVPTMGEGDLDLALIVLSREPWRGS